MAESGSILLAKTAANLRRESLWDRLIAFQRKPKDRDIHILGKSRENRTDEPIYAAMCNDAPNRFDPLGEQLPPLEGQILGQLPFIIAIGIVGEIEACWNVHLCAGQKKYVKSPLTPWLSEFLGCDIWRECSMDSDGNLHSRLVGFCGEGA